MTLSRKKFSLFVVATAYLLAIGMGVWLSNAACRAPGWLLPASYVLLALIILGVAFAPFPRLAEVPLRITLVLGLLVAISFSQAFAGPLFPGIDYDGPESVESYFFNVYLDTNEWFGPCFAPDSRRED